MGLQYSLVIQRDNNLREIERSVVIDCKRILIRLDDKGVKYEYT